MTIDALSTWYQTYEYGLLHEGKLLEDRLDD